MQSSIEGAEMNLDIYFCDGGINGEYHVIGIYDGHVEIRA
jgi:hypothetical protein